jgi:hypothetical protein
MERRGGKGGSVRGFGGGGDPHGGGARCDVLQLVAPVPVPVPVPVPTPTPIPVGVLIPIPNPISIPVVFGALSTK